MTSKKNPDRKNKKEREQGSISVLFHDQKPRVPQWNLEALSNNQI